MNETLTAVRKTLTKKTPKWARTADGIVRRWSEHGDNFQTLSTLRLPFRLQLLFMLGCFRSARVEEEVKSRRGENPIREALNVGERLAGGEQPAGFVLDTLTELQTRLARQSSYLKVVTLFAAARLVMPDHRLMGTRQKRAETDASVAGLLAGLVGVRALRGKGGKIRHSQQPGSTQSRKRRVEAAELAERTRQGQLLAGIVGPDWHLAPEWRTDTAVHLARGIYERREFSTMPILADALQDAGCDNEEWLARMRDPEWPWCRGCHVLDSLLPELVHTGG
jgi:hypothetical protein